MRDRHSVLETLVFGLAGLLALILAYYAYARWAGGRRAGAAPETPEATEIEEPQTAPPGQSRTFHGGGSLPTVRFSEPRKRK